MSIGHNLKHIEQLIRQAESRYGRLPGSVKLIAVSKTFPVEDAMECYQCGQRLFGENKVQEALSKIPVLPSDAQWHLIGPLQRNKVRKIFGKAAMIHTVDSLKLAEYMDSVARELSIVQDVLLEVHVGGEESKFGFHPDELETSWPALCNLEHLNIRGLMCIPPPVDNVEDARPYFRQLRELKERLNASGSRQIQELSMGMSHDFEAAIAEGATFVRVGTAIFGARDYSH